MKKHTDCIIDFGGIGAREEVKFPREVINATEGPHFCRGGIYPGMISALGNFVSITVGTEFVDRFLMGLDRRPIVWDSVAKLSEAMKVSYRQLREYYYLKQKKNASFNIRKCPEFYIASAGKNRRAGFEWLNGQTSQYVEHRAEGARSQREVREIERTGLG